MPPRLSSCPLLSGSSPFVTATVASVESVESIASVTSCARRPRHGRRARTLRHAWLLWGVLACGTAQALAPDAVPMEPRLRQGRAAIARDALGLQIVQTGDHAIIDWRAFDIGRRAAVHIMQTSSEATLLNRVTGATASEIAGDLTATGRVFLVNPNGIDLTPGGTVGAAAFVASTLDITDRDFMAGVLRFNVTARPAAGVIVQAGEITIDSGGYAALLGGQVAHSGVIRTPLGQVGLGAGEGVVLTPGSAAFLQVTRPAAAPQAGLAAIRVSGIIEAHGGLALLSAPMRAASARGANASVDVSGTLLTGQVVSRAGAIVIDGDGGLVRLAGVLDASSSSIGDAREPGGTVDIVARRVAMDGPAIDVRGERGSGRVRLAVNAIEGAETVRCFPHTRLRFVGNGAGGTAPLPPVSVPRLAITPSTPLTSPLPPAASAAPISSTTPAALLPSPSSSWSSQPASAT